MPYTEIAIVDAVTGDPITEPGQRGEIVARRPNVTSGYWEDEAATARAFDDAGYFHSGDIGYLDADGFLFIVDRLKDMIITGGENVYPAEVENALGDLPGVLDVAVVGRPDDKWGETVVAIVAVVPGTELNLDDVRAHAERHLARYKLPRELLVVPSVPRNAAGKINKSLLRQLVVAGKQEKP
jgi:fatty-acyl-CoA synthase